MQFNWRQYVRNYKDLHSITNSRTAKEHYLTTGKAEGRVDTPFEGSDDPFKTKTWEKSVRVPTLPKVTEPASTPFPEWQQYLANYPELSYLTTEAQVSQHYQTVGKLEGRIVTPIREHLISQATTVLDQATDEDLQQAPKGIIFFVSRDEIEKHLHRCYTLEETLPSTIHRIVPLGSEILTLMIKG